MTTIKTLAQALENNYVVFTVQGYDVGFTHRADAVAYTVCNGKGDDAVSYMYAY